MSSIVIGSRGSPLAMWQANHVRDAIMAGNEHLRVDIKIIKTKGDQALAAENFSSLVKGLFTKEIENELLAGSVHLAVHSLKDLPTELADDRLDVAVITKREDPADVLVSKNGLLLDELPAGAEVRTGSLRRKSQLLHKRPDLKVSPVRGNVQTRLGKLDESDSDAMILAAAGLVRCGLSSRITERLDPTDFLPACGQGALAIEIKKDDDQLRKILTPLDHKPTRLAVIAERSFLADLGGGCQVPVGAYGRFKNSGPKLTLTGMVSSLDGCEMLRDIVEADVQDDADAEKLGLALAAKLQDQGCKAILDEVLRQSQEKDS